MNAKQAKQVVSEGVKWALDNQYLMQGPVKPDPNKDPKAKDDTPDNDPFNPDDPKPVNTRTGQTHFENIVTSQIARKWGGLELAKGALFTVAGEQLDSLVKTVAGLERDVKEILTKLKSL